MHCVSGIAGGYWSGGSVTILDRIPQPNQNISTEHVARGMEAGGQIVGYGYAAIDPVTPHNDGRLRRWYIPSSTGQALDLQDESGIVENHECMAHAVRFRSSDERIEVVGANITTGHAILWYTVGAQGWVSLDLNDQPCVPSSQGWTLNHAVDINQDGWIVGYVNKPITEWLTEVHAFMLMPISQGDGSASETFPIDGVGLHGGPDGQSSVGFSSPQASIGVGFAGAVRFRLFSEGELIYTSTSFAPGGVGNFAGLVSTDAFDAAIIEDLFDPVVVIDDLHSGVPVPGGLVLLVPAALAPRRRRG